MKTNVYVIDAIDMDGEWDEQIGYFETREQADAELIKLVEGDDKHDPREYFVRFISEKDFQNV
jgi:hypothetical protein